ncbi:hypothetical protein [Actinomyces naeslundii]|uniref:hypothetical protein n=1 Tax=Actinomyces naeslundii TaxID=1655 RepID=UPI00096DE7B5|nr:hypothetical protein [Actinomyces naeslundii]OMG10484.1 hypothetical protein BKH07_06440 [Actinomyces naeslundii]
MSEDSSTTAGGGVWDTSGGANGDDIPFAPTIDWWALTPQERLEELGQLRVFVARLVVDYELESGVIPPCWERHEWVIRVLDALYRSYLIATHPVQPGEALIGWHHNFVFVRDLLREAFTGSCTASGHVPARSQSWAADIVAGDKDSLEWIRRHREAMAAYRTEAEAAAVAAAGA